MKRDEYLNSEDVRDFLSFLSASIAEPSGEITRALFQYKWPFHFTSPDGQRYDGQTFEENQNALNLLKAGLSQALQRRDNDELLGWCAAVIKWGGVIARNGAWLEANKFILAEELQRIRTEIDRAEDNVISKPTRFNAGMTKIYSLLCSDFIIYDSRVAAALGAYVVRWCQRRGRKDIPTLLNFPWMPPKEGANARNKKRRDPGKQSLKFTRMRSDPSQHLKWNMRASWIASAAVRNLNRRGFDTRSLEAALFALGYDLNDWPDTR